jgi:hypothetical protein
LDESVVKNILRNNRIIAINILAEPVSILIVQGYTPTSEYEDEKMEELCGVIEDTLEEDGKGATDTIIMGEWKSVVGGKSYCNIVEPLGLGRRNWRFQMLSGLFEIIGLVSQIHGLEANDKTVHLESTRRRKPV